MVLILVLSISLSLIYLRYAPKIYEASTTLMLKSEKTTQILGVEQYINEQSETEISREMRLLKSVLLLERVVEALPLQIAYFKEGKTKFIFSELYTSSPFTIDGEVKNNAVLEMPIYVKILSPSKVYLGFTVAGRDYEYTRDTGKTIVTPFFNAIVHIKRTAENENSGVFYFKFLDKKTVVDEISNKLQILPIDPKTQTIGLVYKDRNPNRAQEIVSTVASEFVKYDIERKSESILGIINFINAQIDTFGTTFDRYQDSVSLLRLQENFYDKGEDYLGKLTEKSMEYENRFRDFDYDISLLKCLRTLR